MSAPLDMSPLAGIGDSHNPTTAIVGTSRLSPFAFPRPNDDAVRDARIAIVDDEPSVVQVVRSHLQNVGFHQFELICESRHAFDRIVETMPDLVLLDIRMRPTDGWGILETLRTEEKTQHIPIVILTSAADEKTKITALNLGANDFLTKPVAASELVARVRNTLSAKVYRDLMTRYSSQLESDVLRDALTGIANRRAFDYELKRRIIEWNRQRIPLGLLMIDIDRFKTVNDRHGHRVGDVLLQMVAQILARGTREMDLVARYGGEEFAVILPTTNPRETKLSAERARRDVGGHPFVIDDVRLELTVSVGVANAMHGDDAELLLRRADAALYAAKRGGRNRSEYHDGSCCSPISLPTDNHVKSTSIGPIRNQDIEAIVERARIAIVDDEPHIIALIRKYLKDAGYQHFTVVHDATQALETIRQEEPDLVLLDVRMPHVSGLDILQDLRSDNRFNPVPVVIFTSATDKETKVEALRLGANDYLEKPVHPSELLARVRNTLMAKSHLDYMADYSGRLEHEVQLRTAELAASRREAIQCLARAAEMRDDQTGQHVLRVGRYAALIAEELGFSPDRVTWMEHAAQLHDVGKIGIPDSILRKPGLLEEHEYEVMKLHCTGGSKIIRDEGVSPQGEDQYAALGSVIFDDLNSPVMRMAAVVAETHHERWDGTGYPRGLSGEAIPIEGRITAVADVFDALSTRRHYKDAMPLEQCFKLIAENSGSHFDPAIVNAFFRRKSEIIRTYLDYADAPAVRA